MTGKNIRIRASGGGEFDCYLSLPGGSAKVPAVILASAIHGVDGDIRALADEFAGLGFIAAAPDLFWRSVPGPLVRDDPRSKPRGQPQSRSTTQRRTHPYPAYFALHNTARRFAIAQRFPPRMISLVAP